MAVSWRGVRLDSRTRDMMNELARLTPDLPYMLPSQGSYSNGENSAGTHSGGGAIDIDLAPGWDPGQRWGLIHDSRMIGFAAWTRSPADGPWGWHAHMIAIGCNDLSTAAANQVTDYRNGRNGLANNGPDTGPNVPYTTWEKYQEDSMPTADEIAKAVWNYHIQKVSNPKEKMTAKNFLAYPHSYILDIRRTLTNKLGDSKGPTPRQAWSRAEHRALAIYNTVKAQQPLLEAAAEGKALTPEEVQQIAQAAAAAVPLDIADDVVDELSDRLTEPHE